eukprot:scaffold10949_cov67-Phaeocystis_antarctica.AAC.5
MHAAARLALGPLEHEVIRAHVGLASGRRGADFTAVGKQADCLGGFRAAAQGEHRARKARAIIGEQVELGPLCGIGRRRLFHLRLRALARELAAPALRGGGEDLDPRRGARLRGPHDLGGDSLPPLGDVFLVQRLHAARAFVLQDTQHLVPELPAVGRGELIRERVVWPGAVQHVCVVAARIDLLRNVDRDSELGQHHTRFAPLLVTFIFASAASKSALRLGAVDAAGPRSTSGPLRTVPLAAPDRSESLIAFAYSCTSRSRGRWWPTARSVVIKTSGLGAMAGKAVAAQSEPTSTSLRVSLLSVMVAAVGPKKATWNFFLPVGLAWTERGERRVEDVRMHAQRLIIP